MHLNMYSSKQKQPQIILKPGEVVSYSRKSTAGEGAHKSITDQNEVNEETAQEWELPLIDEFVYSEAEGYGGNLWWEGGGYRGIETEDTAEKKRGRTRPVLTQIVNGIRTGLIKCLIVYSLDRLWRDVGICTAIIELMAEQGCLLFDRDGHVDILSPDGRSAVIASANAAEHQRKMAQVTSPRGIAKNLRKGKRIVTANVLGFRNVAGKRGEVQPVPQEQELVNRIYRLYDSGDGQTNESGNLTGPLSPQQIAKCLMEEGLEWMPDLASVRSVKRTEDSKNVVYDLSIRRVLTDCRYQGRQLYNGEEFACPSFLKPDGDSLVPPAIYERVQAKINGLKRGSNATRNSYPLAGLVRCGVCGQCMNTGLSPRKIYGVTTPTKCWKAFRAATWCWCTHDLPVIEYDDLDNYINEIIAPLLLAEVSERTAQDAVTSVLNEKARIMRSITEAERQYDEVLPSYMGHIPPDVLGMKFRECAGQIGQLRVEMRKLEEKAGSLCDYSECVTNITDLNESARRDAIRAVLRWVAFIPSDLPMINGRDTDFKWVPSNEAGRIVFLTAWGTLHTAFVYRARAEGQMKRVCRIRPATISESIGSVRDFPDPDAFVNGLNRSYKGRKYKYAPQDVAPGYYTSDQDVTPIFDIE